MNKRELKQLIKGLIEESVDDTKIEQLKEHAVNELFNKIDYFVDIDTMTQDEFDGIYHALKTQNVLENIPKKMVMTGRFTRANAGKT